MGLNEFISFLFNITFILFGHTVADFIFQSNWMAINKSSRIQALLSHIVTYTTVLGLFIAVLSFYRGVQFIGSCVFLSVNTLAHFITDFITSRITSNLWKQEKRHAFFITIGFDQLAHVVVLIWTFLLIFCDQTDLNILLKLIFK